MESQCEGITFLKLPVELIIQILSYLEISDIYSIYDTCQFLHNIINDEELWKNLFLQKHNTTRFSSVAKSYKYSIELIKRQQLLTKWKKATSVHKNLIIDVPNVEKLIFQYPRVISFTDQGSINIMSIDKGKSEVTIPITTPSGCTSYHFNPSGSVFGRYDGKIYSKLLNGKSSYVSSVSQFNGVHEGVVTAIYNDDVNCFSGDEKGEVYKWDLKNREILNKYKVSMEAVLKIKGSNNSIVTVNHHKVHVLENDLVKAIELKDFGAVEFFEVDFAGKLIILASLSSLRVYSFDQFLFGKYHQLDFKDLDEILRISLEDKKSIDTKLAGKDGCNLGVLTRTGIVMCINIRDINSKNGIDLQPHVIISPIVDNLNVPEGIPPIRSIAVNSTVILLGSYNGFAAIYDVLTGDFLRTVSVRIPKRYLLLTENSFLIPVKSVELGANNETHGLLLINNIIQYFKFGHITDHSKTHKKKVKKSIAGVAGDRKNTIHKKIKHDIDELAHREYELYENEKLLNKYNGDELTDQEQMELAMVLNDSLQEHQRHKREIREGKAFVDEDECDKIEDELAHALEISRLEHEHSVEHTSNDSEFSCSDLITDDTDDDYERQIQEALRRSLYE